MKCAVHKRVVLLSTMATQAITQPAGVGCTKTKRLRQRFPAQSLSSEESEADNEPEKHRISCGSRKTGSKPQSGKTIEVAPS